MYLEYTYQHHFSTCHLYNTREDNHILNRWKLGIINSMKQVVNMLMYTLYMVYTERIPLGHRDCVLYSVSHTSLPMMSGEYILSSPDIQTTEMLSTCTCTCTGYSIHELTPPMWKILEIQDSHYHELRYTCSTSVFVGAISRLVPLTQCGCTLWCENRPLTLFISFSAVQRMRVWGTLAVPLTEGTKWRLMKLVLMKVKHGMSLLTLAFTRVLVRGRFR